MRRILRHRPSPALIVACLALTIALGGTSYAAVTLPRNSVGTAQLKRNAVTSVKVKNFTLLRADFKRGQIPAGPRGPQGPTGATGATGGTGATGPPGAPNPNADTLNGYAANGIVRMTKSATFLGGLNVAWPNFGQSPTRATLTVPGNGFVLVQFEGTFYTFDGTCAAAGCNAIVRLRDLGNNAVSPYQIGSVSKTGGAGAVTVPATWIFPVTAGTRQFAMEHSTETGINKIDFQNASITAFFVPFGASGGGVLGPAGTSKVQLGASSVG